MAESTLSLTRDQLRQSVAVVLGYGLVASDWDSAKREALDLCVNEGLRDFYFPNTDGSKPRYEWSFLCVTGTITLATTDFSYTLPDNFGGIVRRMVHTAGVGTSHVLQPMDVDELLHLQLKEAATSTTMVPKYFAIQPVDISPTTTQTQRWQVLLYPTPVFASGTFTLKFEYPANPDSPLPSSNTYVLGGAQYSSAIQQCCRRAAERLFLPESTRWSQEADRAMAAAIEYDKLVKQSSSQVWLATEPEFGTYQWLQREVGGAKYGWNPNLWSYADAGLVNSFINRGYRQFVELQQMPVAEGQKPEKPHIWTFRTPVMSLELDSDDYTYDLPADFGGVVGGITFPSGTAQRTIRSTDTTTILTSLAMSDEPGTPRNYAIRQRIDAGTSEQVKEILLYPPPDDIYTVSFRYLRVCENLSATNKYPMGGREHAETLLAACKMVMAEGTPEYDQAMKVFLNRVQGSIRSDKELAKAEESSRAITTPERGSYEWFQQEIGLETDAGPNFNTWTSTQERQVDSFIQRGLNLFYGPPKTMAKFQRAHRWSFLSPVLHLTTSAPYAEGTIEVVMGVAILTGGEWPVWAFDGVLVIEGVPYDVDYRLSSTQIALKDDTIEVDAGTEYSLNRPYYTQTSNIRSFEGPFVFENGSGSTMGGKQIAIASEAQLRAVRAYWAETGVPEFAALFTGDFVSQERPVRRILLAPTPNAEYRLTVRTHVNPLPLQPGDFPLAGEEYYETLRAACMACVDPKKTEPFMNYLAGAIEIDQRQAGPETLGSNRDYSDRFGAYNMLGDGRYAPYRNLGLTSYSGEG